MFWGLLHWKQPFIKIFCLKILPLLQLSKALRGKNSYWLVRAPRLSFIRRNLDHKWNKEKIMELNPSRSVTWQRGSELSRARVGGRGLNRHSNLSMCKEERRERRISGVWQSLKLGFSFKCLEVRKYWNPFSIYFGVFLECRGVAIVPHGTPPICRLESSSEPHDGIL